MTYFERSAHWRMNPSDTLSRVRAHDVYRDEWSRTSPGGALEASYTSHRDEKRLQVIALVDQQAGAIRFPAAIPDAVVPKIKATDHFPSVPEFLSLLPLLWLPNRSPQLNSLDPLWGHAKDRVSANLQRETIEEHVDGFPLYLEGLTPEQALRLAGVFSENFWLKSVL